MNNPDSGPTVQDDDWAAAVESATAHVSEEAADLARPRTRSHQPTLLVFLGIAVTGLVALWTPKLMPAPAPSLSLSEQAADLRAEAVLLIEQIEAVKAETGALPPRELLAPFLEDGYEYHVLNQAAGDYLVRRTGGGVTVTYDGTLTLGLWLLLGS